MPNADQTCVHCGRTDVNKSYYILMGTVAGLFFGITIFTLGYFFRVVNVWKQIKLDHNGCRLCWLLGTNQNTIPMQWSEGRFKWVSQCKLQEVILTQSEGDTLEVFIMSLHLQVVHITIWTSSKVSSTGGTIIEIICWRKMQTKTRTVEGYSKTRC